MSGSRSFHIDILRQLYDIQQQHGLRNDDYARYRNYLTRRLERLYHSLGMTHGKGKFQKRPITAESVTDPRHIVVVMLWVERAWAHTQDRLRDITLNPQIAKRARHHVRSRTSKCVELVSQLRALADQFCDENTKAQITAYQLDMLGRSAQANEQHAEAKKMFSEAHNAYAALRSSTSEEDWPVIVMRLQQLEECHRHAVHCLGGSSSDASSGLAPLTQYTADSSGPAITWAGRPIVLSSTRLATMVKEICEHEKASSALAAAVDTHESLRTMTTFNKTVDAYEKLFAVCNDVLQSVRADIRSEVGDVANLQLLQHYVSFALCKGRCDRTQMYINVYRARLDAITQGKRLKSVTTTMDVGHLYHSLADQVRDVLHLPGLDDGVAEEHDVLLLYARAGALFYKGLTWARAEETPLIAKGYECVVQADGLLAEAALLGVDLPRLVELQSTVKAHRCRLIALHALASSKAVSTLADDVDGMNVADGSSSIPAAKRRCCASDYPPAMTGKNITRFASLQPHFEMLLPKPAFYDVASAYLGTADLASTLLGEDVAKTQTPQKQGSWLSGWFKK
eukprot:PhM_4_TR14667/c0_g1_i1/m.35537/K03107/SRP68; signal recognition particle subunit SRP68